MGDEAVPTWGFLCSKLMQVFLFLCFRHGESWIVQNVALEFLKDKILSLDGALT